MKISTFKISVHIVFLLFVSFFLNSCYGIIEEEEEEEIWNPVIEISIGEVGSSYVDVVAKIVSLGNKNTWENKDVTYGFLWFPMIYDQGEYISGVPIEIQLGKIEESDQVSFTYLINNLESNTDYTICAYVSDENGMYPVGETTVVTDL